MSIADGMPNVPSGQAWQPCAPVMPGTPWGEASQPCAPAEVEDTPPQPTRQHTRSILRVPKPDKFSTLVSQLHELHVSQIADLETEMQRLRSQSPDPAAATSSIVEWKDMSAANRSRTSLSSASANSDTVRQISLPKKKSAAFSDMQPLLFSDSNPPGSAMNVSTNIWAGTEKQVLDLCLGENSDIVASNALELTSNSSFAPGGYADVLEGDADDDEDDEEFRHQEKLQKLRNTVGGLKTFQQLKPDNHWISRFSSMPLDDDSDEGWSLRHLVQHPYFEVTFAGLIVLNALVMAMDVQYDGIQVGYELEYPGSRRAAATAWPNGKKFLIFFDWVFGIVFIVEVVLNLFALRSRFFTDLWNWFDVLVCTLFVAEKISASFMQISTSTMKSLRLGRLMRLVRLVKTLRTFDAFFLMTTAIQGSIAILWWALILLFLVQLVLAVFLSQMLHGTYFEDESQPLEHRLEVYEYLGTFSRSMLTMFELTLANWPPVCRMLMEKVTEWFMVFCLAHKLVIGFAVIGIINSVFMQETLKIAGSDPDIMVRRKRQANETHVKKMMSLFEYLDVSGDGRIDLEEFQIISDSALVKSWLGSMELETDDLPAIFSFIDSSGTGEISVDELIKGVAKLKGPARSTDVLRILRLLTPGHGASRRSRSSRSRSLMGMGQMPKSP